MVLFNNDCEPICPICGNPIVLYRFDENKKTCGNPSCVSTLANITSIENGTFDNKLAGLKLTSKQRSDMAKKAWSNPKSKLNSSEYREFLSKTMSNTMNSIWSDQYSRVVLSAKQYLGAHYDSEIYLYEGLIDNNIKIGITKDLIRRPIVEFFRDICDSYKILKKFNSIIEGVFAEAYIHLNYGITGTEYVNKSKLPKIYKFIDKYDINNYTESELYKSIIK